VTYFITQGKIMNTLNAVRQNFEEKATYLARQIPGIAVVDHGSFLLVDSGVPSDTFNVIVVRELADTGQLLDTGVGYFMDKQLPMAVWYWEGAADHAGIDALLAYGLTTNETDFAMSADLAQANLHVAPPTGLTIKLVESADELQQFASVLDGSDEAKEVAAYFQRFSQFAPDHFPAMRYYIGLYHNQAVATGTLFVGNETIGIYDIVTDEPFRRQGIGSAMFGHLLNEAASLERTYAVLQASAAGIGIYTRAGFVAVGNVHVFENRSLLAQG
jgi:GNAT superfamily N-acetyltransferase